MSNNLYNSTNIFDNDKERIKKLTKQYANTSIAEAFSNFYNVKIDVSNKQAKNVTAVLELGKVYLGKVKQFSGDFIEFEVGVVKEDIICKENFNYCYVEVQNYLNTHNNSLYFQVREYKNGKFIVSVINAYYLHWKNMINKYINNETPINVHIDELVKGGYICHTEIEPLSKLTGRTYTHSVFIPGSHIVLNIEHDFDRWVGEDVEIVPQKIVDIVPKNAVDYKKRMQTGETEQSIVGSRKKVLENIGMNNLYNMYINHTQNDEAKETIYNGTVTGVINSNNKKGVFVELDGMYITGLMEIDSTDLFKYKPGDKVCVTVKTFEVQENKTPFVFNTKTKNLVKCNTRVVFNKSTSICA